MGLGHHRRMGSCIRGRVGVDLYVWWGSWVSLGGGLQIVVIENGGVAC
jgi:hypothetical protein